MVLERRQQRAREVHLPRVAVLGRAQLEGAVAELVERTLDPHRTGSEIEVVPVEPEHLAPPQRAPSGQVTADRYCSGIDWVSAATWSTLGTWRSVTRSVPPPLTRQGFLTMRSSRMAVLKMALSNR